MTKSLVKLRCPVSLNTYRHKQTFVVWQDEEHCWHHLSLQADGPVTQSEYAHSKTAFGFKLVDKVKSGCQAYKNIHVEIQILHPYEYL